MIRASVILSIGLVSLSGCSRVSFFLANAGDSLGAFHRTADLAYGPDSRQKLDVYVPERPRSRLVVVFFYGGSWSSGDKSDYEFVAAALSERGYLTVIPDYRLYPQVVFPAFVADAARAVAWVEGHAADWGGDPRRIVLMGHSAGAQIAALLALDPAYLSAASALPRSMAALIGLSGPYALVPDTAQLRDIFAAPYTKLDWQPVRFASHDAPPALLLHGLDDTVVYAAQTEKLRDALLACGARVETHLYPGRGHADTIGAFSLVDRFRTPALEDTVRFLQHLDGAKASRP